MPGLSDLLRLLGGGLGGLGGVLTSGTVFRAYAETTIGTASGPLTRRFLLTLDSSAATGLAPLDNYLDVDMASPQKPDLRVRLTPNAALTQIKIEMRPMPNKLLTGLTLTVYFALDGDVWGGPTVPNAFAFVEFRGGPAAGSPARLFPGLTAILDRPTPGIDETIGLSFQTTNCVEPLWIEAGSFKSATATVPATQPAYVDVTDTYTETAQQARAGDRQNSTEAVRAELIARDRTPANLTLDPLSLKLTSAYAIPRPRRTTTATLAGQGAGSVDRGPHSYRVTFLLRNGNETSPSLPTAPIEVTDPAADGIVRLTAIPTGPSQGGQPLDVVGRRIYRSLAGDRGEHFLVAALSDNTTTQYDDKTADEDLGEPPPGRLKVEYGATTSLDLTAVIRTRDPESGNDRIEATTEVMPTAATAVQDDRATPRLRYTANAALGLIDLTLPTLDGPETTYARVRARGLPQALSGHWRNESEYRSQLELAGSKLGQPADAITELALVLSRGVAPLPTLAGAVRVESTANLDAAGRPTPASLTAAVPGLRRLRISLGEKGTGPVDSDPWLIAQLGAPVDRPLQVLINGVHPNGVRDYSDLTVTRIPDLVELWAVLPRTIARPRRTTQAALAGVGAGSVDAGTHSYRVTFVLRNGNETGPSLVTAAVAVADPAADGRVLLTAIPTGPSHGNRPLDVIARRIYRSRAGDRGEHFRLTELKDNTTTEFTDDVADADLADPLPGRASVRYIGSAALTANALLKSFDREEGVARTIDAKIAALPPEIGIDYASLASPRLRYSANAVLGRVDVTLPTLDGPETTYARAVVSAAPTAISANWRFDSERRSVIEIGGPGADGLAEPIGAVALVLAHGPSALPAGRQAVAVELVDERQQGGAITRLHTRVAVSQLRRFRLATGEAGVHSLPDDGLKLILVHGKPPSMQSSHVGTPRPRSLRFLRHVDRYVDGQREHSRLWVRAGSLAPAAELDLRSTGDEYLGLRVQGETRLLKVLSLESPTNAFATDRARIWLTGPETGAWVDFVSDAFGQRLTGDRNVGAELSLRDPSAPARSAGAFRHIKTSLWLPSAVQLHRARHAYGTADAGSTATALVDAGAEFNPAWKSINLRWRSGALAGQRRPIVAITDGTHLTTQAFASAPAAGDRYAIESAPTEGTADAGSTSTELVDAAGAFDTTWSGMTLTYTSGSQLGRSRRITAVTDASRLTTEAFSGAPAAGDSYRIEGATGLTLETAGTGAAGRVAVGREADRLLAVRATPQVRLRNAPAVGPASSSLHGATGRLLGVGAFNLTTWGSLVETHAELAPGRPNKSLRVALQEQPAIDTPTRDMLKARISSVPADTAMLIGPGDGVYELRLSEASGEGSLWVEPRQQRKEKLRSPLALLIKRAPVALSPERGVGLLSLNFDAIPRGVRVSLIGDASGAPFTGFGWTVPANWEVPAMRLDVSEATTVRFLRMISYSHDGQPPWPPPTTFHWSRSDAKIISWAQQSPVAAPGRPALKPFLLFTPSEIVPAQLPKKESGIGFEVDDDLRVTVDLDSYSGITDKELATWSSFQGKWKLEAELQMQDFSGGCLIVPEAVGGPVAGGDEAGRNGQWFLRAVNARPFEVSGGSVFFGNTGGYILSRPRIFQ